MVTVAGERTVWLLGLAVALVGLVGRESCGEPPPDPQCWPGTETVHWTWYQEENATGKETTEVDWSTAATFCQNQGGSLSAPKTPLARNAMVDLLNGSGLWGEFWIGLSKFPDEPQYVWAGDCIAQPKSASFFSLFQPTAASSSSPSPSSSSPPPPSSTTALPNASSSNTEICVAVNFSEDSDRAIRFADSSCSDKKRVVCEFKQDADPFDLYDNYTLTLDWNATTSSVSDAESCRRSCLQVLLLDFECVAAVFQKNDSLCKMHLGQRLLGPERLAGLLCQNGHSVAMVRSGFSFNYTTEEIPSGTSDLNTENLCPQSSQPPPFKDCVPLGVTVAPNSTAISSSRCVTYTVDVTTRNEIYAGTDDEVYVEIVGQNNGSTGPLILASPSAANISNTFEPGVTGLFRLEATDVVEIKKVVVSLHRSPDSRRSAWFLDKIAVDGPAADDPYVFVANTWLVSGSPEDAVLELWPSEPANTIVTYDIHITTKDYIYAGTDDTVHLQIFGSQGSTEIHHLSRSENNQNSFEEGNTDQFLFTDVSVGKVQKIVVSRDKSSSRPGWFLEAVHVHIPTFTRQYSFRANTWLADWGDRYRTTLEILYDPDYVYDRYNSCVNEPCKNGGSCTVVSETRYKCTCRPGYRDLQCSTGSCPHNGSCELTEYKGGLESLCDSCQAFGRVVVMETEELKRMSQTFCQGDVRGFVVRLKTSCSPASGVQTLAGNHTYQLLPLKDQSCTLPCCHGDYELGMYVVGCDNVDKLGYDRYVKNGTESNVLCKRRRHESDLFYCDSSTTAPPDPDTTMTTTTNTTATVTASTTVAAKNDSSARHICQVIEDLTQVYNMSVGELKTKLAQDIKNALTIDVSSLSKTLAKKISAPDRRVSSQSTGYLAITLLTVVFGLIVLSDLNRLVHFLRRKPVRERLVRLLRKPEEERKKKKMSFRPGDGADAEQGDPGGSLSELEEGSEATIENVTELSSDDTAKTSVNTEAEAEAEASDVDIIGELADERIEGGEWAGKEEAELEEGGECDADKHQLARRKKAARPAWRY